MPRSIAQAIEGGGCERGGGRRYFSKSQSAREKTLFPHAGPQLVLWRNSLALGAAGLGVERMIGFKNANAAPWRPENHETPGRAQPISTPQDKRNKRRARLYRIRRIIGQGRRSPQPVIRATGQPRFPADSRAGRQ